MINDYIEVVQEDWADYDQLLRVFFNVFRGKKNIFKKKYPSVLNLVIDFLKIG